MVLTRIDVAKNTTGTQASSSAANPQNPNVPAWLTDAAESGEGVYDVAHASNWQQAEDRLNALKNALRKIAKAQDKVEQVFAR